MKDSFILYLEQKEIFETLSDSEAGKLIKAIFEYESTGQSPKLNKTLNLVFIPIKNALDRNKEKYQKVIERNKKNICKRWNKENTKNTTGKTGIPKNTKNTDNDNEHDSVHVSDSKHDSVSDSDIRTNQELAIITKKICDKHNIATRIDLEKYKSEEYESEVNI